VPSWSNLHWYGRSRQAWRLVECPEADQGPLKNHSRIFRWVRFNLPGGNTAAS